MKFDEKTRAAVLTYTALLNAALVARMRDIPRAVLDEKGGEQDWDFFENLDLKGRPENKTDLFGQDYLKSKFHQTSPFFKGECVKIFKEKLLIYVKDSKALDMHFKNISDLRHWFEHKKWQLPDEEKQKDKNKRPDFSASFESLCLFLPEALSHQVMQLIDEKLWETVDYSRIKKTLRKHRETVSKNFNQAEQAEACRFIREKFCLEVKNVSFTLLQTLLFLGEVNFWRIRKVIELASADIKEKFPEAKKLRKEYFNLRGSSDKRAFLEENWSVFDFFIRMNILLQEYFQSFFEDFRAYLTSEAYPGLKRQDKKIKELIGKKLIQVRNNIAHGHLFFEPLSSNKGQEFSDIQAFSDNLREILAFFDSEPVKKFKESRYPEGKKLRKNENKEKAAFFGRKQSFLKALRALAVKDDFYYLEIKGPGKNEIKTKRLTISQYKAPGQNTGQRITLPYPQILKERLQEEVDKLRQNPQHQRPGVKITARKYKMLAVVKSTFKAELQEILLKDAEKNTKNLAKKRKKRYFFP